jgi:hypothetical protein
MLKKGISSLNKNNKEVVKEKNNNFFKSVRVTDIVLDNSHPKFEQVGGWDNIGIIFYEDLIDFNSQPNRTAKPLFTNNILYPLINEIVYIQNFPTTSDIQDLENDYGSYYFAPVNLWNSIEHNAYPNNINNVKVSISIDYENFIEKQIKKLIPSTGDNIISGRFGNSIRFGSTNKNNIWSNNTVKGDPILILRNSLNQPETLEPWEGIFENFNTDDSSIYLTSTQKLKFNNNIDFKSFQNNVISLNDYNKPQIILSSNRIILNIKEDYLIIGVKKLAYINSKRLGITNERTIIDSPDIILGNEDAKNYVLLGTDFLNELKLVLVSLDNVSKGLQQLKDWPGGAPVPNVLMPLVGKNLSLKVNNLINKINSPKTPLLSKTTKVK